MNNSFHNHLDRIDDIYAFIATDAKGNEGLPAFFHNIGFLPLVAADAARIASLQEIAKRISKASGQTLRLYRFTGRELLATITPDAAKN